MFVVFFACVCQWVADIGVPVPIRRTPEGDQKAAKHHVVTVALPGAAVLATDWYNQKVACARL
jgi:hypothetical protein